MIGMGSRSVKKIDGNEYLYYMYYDDDGKKITKYCGPNNTDPAELVALETELENLLRMHEVAKLLIAQIRVKRDKIKKRIQDKSG